MNKKGMSILTIVLILIALTIGSAISMSNLSTQQVELLKSNVTNVTHSVDFNFNQTELPKELSNALDYYATGLLLAYGELMNWVIDYTSRNPQIPYKTLFYLLIISIFAPIILVLVKLIIIFYLLIKEFIQSRRDKRELRALKSQEDFA